eukprot:scaffold128719_cov51-Phaeocystis_antarctica.AAC.4
MVAKRLGRALGQRRLHLKYYNAWLSHCVARVTRLPNQNLGRRVAQLDEVVNCVAQVVPDPRALITDALTTCVPLAPLALLALLPRLALLPLRLLLRLRPALHLLLAACLSEPAAPRAAQRATSQPHPPGRTGMPPRPRRPPRHSYSRSAAAHERR